MGRNVLLVFLFCLFGCLPPANISLNGGALTTPAGHSYHWDTSSFPIKVLIDSDMHPHLRHATFEAMEHWNDEVGLQVFMVEAEISFDETPITSLEYSNYATVSTRQLDRNNRGNVINGQAILPADERGRLSHCNLWIDIDLKHDRVKEVMVHEFGHALGLAHDPNDPRSIMHPTTSVPTPQYIMPDDVQWVRDMMQTRSDERFYNAVPLQ